MKKKWGLSAAAALLSTAVLLSGCGAKQEPKEALKAAATQVTELKSYEMKSTVVLNDLKMDLQEDETAGMSQVVSMLKNAEMTVEGVYQADPMQTEATLTLNLKGDMAMSFTMPMVMTSEKIYVKVPSIPFLPLPETMVGKFIELDLKELAAEEGTEFNPAAMDTQKLQKLSNEVADAILSEYDQEKYFKNVSNKDANLPEGVDAKQVVRFEVTNDNVKEAITILVNNALPKVIDILSKEEYRTMLEIEQADLDEMKTEIQSGEAKKEFDEGLAELDKVLTINQFQVNTALNKDDFPVYQDMVMNINFKDPDSSQNIGLSLKGSNQYSRINEKPEFKIGIPQGDDVMTMEEFEQEMDSFGSY